MSEHKEFAPIADIESKKIASLSDRPNQSSRYGQGGLTAQQLKAKFDELSDEIIQKYNDLVSGLSGDEAAKYVRIIGLNGINTLYDLAAAVNNGSLADLMKFVPDGYSANVQYASVSDCLREIYEALETLKVDLDSIDQLSANHIVLRSHNSKLELGTTEPVFIYSPDYSELNIESIEGSSVFVNLRGTLNAADGISIDGEAVASERFVEEYVDENCAPISHTHSQYAESSDLDEVRSIAMGATQAVVYNSYADMVTALLAEQTPSLSVGQNIYIGTMQVPDLWVSAVTNTKSSMYTTESAILNRLKPISEGGNETLDLGFYHLKALETLKVDLTSCASADHTHSDYMTSSDVAFAIAQAVGAVINTAI